MTATTATVATSFVLRLIAGEGNENMEIQSGSMTRNGNTVATVATVAHPAPMASILSRFVLGRSSIPTPKSDTQRLTELFEERAAIREFDGGLSRVDAEILAREDVKRMQEPPR